MLVITIVTLTLYRQESRPLELPPPPSPEWRGSVQRFLRGQEKMVAKKKVSTFCVTLGDDRSILQIYELKDVPKYKLKVGNKDSYLTEKDLHKPIMYFANLKSTEYPRESYAQTPEPIFDMDMIRALEQSIESNLAKQDRAVLENKRLLKPDVPYISIENRDYKRGGRAFKPWIDTASHKKTRTHELVEKLTELLEKESGSAAKNGRDTLNHIHIFEPGSDVTEDTPIKIRNQILLSKI